jgi:hypothetical protein
VREKYKLTCFTTSLFLLGLNLSGAISALFLVSALPVLAGDGYRLRFDKFENKQIADYALKVGDECKLTETSRSTLRACSFLSVSTYEDNPSVLLMTTANGWDIMVYELAWPYSDQKAPAIITYKNGTKKSLYLSAIFSGDIIGYNVVAETVIIRFGSVKNDILNISNIELKYGTNKYSLKFDDVLTQKALNYQE